MGPGKDGGSRKITIADSGSRPGKAGSPLTEQSANFSDSRVSMRYGVATKEYTVAGEGLRRRLFRASKGFSRENVVIELVSMERAP